MYCSIPGWGFALGLVWVHAPFLALRKGWRGFGSGDEGPSSICFRKRSFGCMLPVRSFLMVATPVWWRVQVSEFKVQSSWLMIEDSEFPYRIPAFEARRGRFACSVELSSLFRSQGLRLKVRRTISNPSMDGVAV